MIRRKLESLEYPLCDTFDINDKVKMRNLVLWLEDHRIKLYEMEAREELRNIRSENWEVAFKIYLDTMRLPDVIDRNKQLEVIDWLLSSAIRYKYEDNVGKYSEACSNKVKQGVKKDPKMVRANPLDKFDFGSPEFIEGINQLGNHLGVTNHPNHLVTLEAIATLVKTRMSTNVLKNLEDLKPKGKPYPFMEMNMGFESGDYVANQASKILRLLYLHDLRDLQTKINECLVAVQTITANPKTDTKLGKVGF